MKLTNEQIQQIDYLLRKYYTFEKFDDVRIELLDHIAMDIEFEMNENQISFEDACTKVIAKWNNEISWDRNSRYDSVPNIVSRLWKKLDWKYNYSAILLTLLIAFGLLYFRKEMSLAYITYSVALIGLIVSVYLIKLHRNNKYNTVLSVYTSNQIYIYTGVLIITVIMNIGLNIYNKDVKSLPALWVITHTTIVMILRVVLMRKNIRIENQLLKML